MFQLKILYRGVFLRYMSPHIFKLLLELDYLFRIKCITFIETDCGPLPAALPVRFHCCSGLVMQLHLEQSINIFSISECRKCRDTEKSRDISSRHTSSNLYLYTSFYHREWKHGFALAFLSLSTDKVCKYGVESLLFNRKFKAEMYGNI